ncbi:MAG: hypothetical protein U0457_00890 [Candidatus Sericytochromatia bacterium]
MKKILTYSVVLSMILSFSMDESAYAIDYKQNIEQSISIDLKDNNFISKISEDNKVFLANNTSEVLKNDFNPFFLNFIIPGFTQFYYGDVLKGSLFIGGIALSFILPIVLLNSVAKGGAEGGLLLFWIPMIVSPILYVWSIVDASFMVNERKDNKKVSLKDENLINISFLEKNFR